MTKISFEEFIKNENQKLKQIEDSMEINKTGVDFMNELVNLYPVLAIAYESELNKAFSDLKVIKKYSDLVVEAEKLTKMILSYKLDHATQKLIITDLTKTMTTKDCISVPEFIKNQIKIDKSNIYYYAVLSFFCQEENFEIIQLGIASKK